MKQVICDRCGSPGAFWYFNIRDPFAQDSQDKARSIKRDLCRDCARAVMVTMGLKSEASRG